MPYIMAYDIADPGRLRRVARLLERHALRCQKSVFLFQADRPAVEALLDQAPEPRWKRRRHRRRRRGCGGQRHRAVVARQ